MLKLFFNGLVSCLAVIGLSSCANRTHLLATDSGLYLHFLAPTGSETNTEPQAECLLTTKIQLGKKFKLVSNATGQTVSGKIEARNGKLFASLSGSYGTSTGFFEGEAKPEKPLLPGYIFSGAVFLSYFVVSTNSNCQPFIARNPYLVDGPLTE